MSSLESTLSVPQSIHILHQAVLLGQKAGIYSLNDATLIKKSLDSLRYRLHLDENFNPVGSSQPQQQVDVLRHQEVVQQEVLTQTPHQAPQPESHQRQIVNSAVAVQDLHDSRETQ